MFANAQKVVALVLVQDGQGRILLGKRRDNNRWTLPGGHANPDEDPATAALRELREEAGLGVASLTPLTTIEPVTPDHPRIHCYSALANGGPPESSQDPDQEVETWQWVDARGGLPANVYDHLHGPPGDLNVLRRIFDLRRNESRTWLNAGFADLGKALAEIPMGEVTKPGVYDYTHVAPAGYRVTVAGEGDPHGERMLTAIAHHGSGTVGMLAGTLTGDTVSPHYAELEPAHRGKGVGLALYEALLAHAKHHGATRVVGDVHSTSAAALHRRLAAKHGLAYAAEQQAFPERGADFDNAYGPYGYELKGELEPAAKAERLGPTQPTPPLGAPEADDLLEDNPVIPDSQEGLERLVVEVGEPYKELDVDVDLAKAIVPPPPMPDWQHWWYQKQGGYWEHNFRVGHREVVEDLPTGGRQIRTVEAGTPYTVMMERLKPGETGEPALDRFSVAADRELGEHPLELRFYNIKQRFGDARGTGYEITGSGHAKEVLGHVGHSVAQALVTHKPQVLTFSAAEPSRARLYRTLAAKVGTAGYPYRAYQVAVPGEGTTRFALVHQDADEKFRKLAAKHKLQPTPVEPLASVAKRELDPPDNEVQTLLRHPDFRERAMALKLHGVTPHDLAVAVLDPHPEVFRAAYKHPDSAYALRVLAAHTRDASGAPLRDRHEALLKDRRLTASHVRAMRDAVQADADLPLSDQASWLERIRKHPLHHAVVRQDAVHAALAKHWGEDIIAYPAGKFANHASEPVPDHVKDLHDAWRLHGASVDPIHGSWKDLANTHLAGSSPKVVYHLPTGHRVMVKPYAEPTSHDTGWNELTSQALYHAAGVGHLHQRVTPIRHGLGDKRVPAIAIHLEDGKPVNQVPGVVLRSASSDAHKIALMDFLLRNNDRHAENLLHRPDGRLLAIDQALLGDGHQPLHTYLGTVWKPLGTGGGVATVRGAADPETAAAAELPWWRTASREVRRAFDDRLKLVYDRNQADRLGRTFHARADWLDARAAEHAAGTLRPGWTRSAPEPVAKALGGFKMLAQQPREGGGELHPAEEGHLPHLKAAHPPSLQPAVNKFERLNQSDQVLQPQYDLKPGDNGVEPKAIYKHPTGKERYLLKPYHSLGYGGNQPPHTAWNELTSQALFHAAGVGHLHQKVHVTERRDRHGEAQPAVVVHMEPDAVTLGEADREDLPHLRTLERHTGHQRSLRQIHAMDMVTGNQDRHDQNLLLGPDGKPTAIDHGHAFSYDRQYAGGHRPTVDDQDPNVGVIFPGAEGTSRFGSPMAVKDPEFDRWWAQARPAIATKFDEHAAMLQDPAYRERMRQSFHHRLDLVDRLLTGRAHAASVVDPGLTDALMQTNNASAPALGRTDLAGAFPPAAVQ